MSVAEAPQPIRRWQWPAGTHEKSMQTVPAILWTLHELGGEIHDKRTGFALSKLVSEAERMGWPVHPGTNMSQMLANLEDGRYGRIIERETNGRKTYTIRLLLSEAELPPRPNKVKSYPVESVPKKSVFAAKVKSATETVEEEVDRLKAMLEADTAPESETPELVVPSIPPLMVVSDDPMDLLLQIQQLSMTAVMALATSIGTPVPSPDNSAERDAERARLATTLEENNRLRRKLNEATETLVSKTKQCEALQKALALANNNLATIQNAANQAPDRERKLANLRGVERLMQQPPGNDIR